MTNTDYPEQYVTWPISSTDAATKAHQFVAPGIYVDPGLIEVQRSLEEIRMTMKTMLNIASEMAEVNRQAVVRSVEIDQMMAACRSLLIEAGAPLPEPVSGPDLAGLTTDGRIVYGKVRGEGARIVRSERVVTVAPTQGKLVPLKADGGVKIPDNIFAGIKRIVGKSRDASVLVCNEATGLTDEQWESMHETPPVKEKWSLNVNDIKDTGFVGEDHLAEFIKSLRDTDKDALYLMLHREGCRLDVHAMEKFRKSK